MKKSHPISVGHCTLNVQPQSVHGDIVTLDNETCYKISRYDLMSCFFMNIVSNSDLWMFISSNGALTAGRRNPDAALFPYKTDDQIHDSQETTGSKTIVFVIRDKKTFLWEPFSDRYRGLYRIERNIYKNILGNQVIFEEINHDLNTVFQYAWLNCDRFGWIKRARIRNNNTKPVDISLLDGIQNILPASVDRKLQLEYSTLVDGYKKNELQTDTGVAVYTLSSIPTDRAEPNESLRANTVWSAGLDRAVILLSTEQMDSFRRGRGVEQETDVHGKRGAYFLSSEFELFADTEKVWYIVADVNTDQSAVVALSRTLVTTANIKQQIENEVALDSERLTQRIARADGLEQTGDALNDVRHCSNTLFNIMRGGIFDSGYYIQSADFKSFIRNANKPLAARQANLLDNLPGQIKVHEMTERLSSSDPDLERLSLEYLPLSFSRRHGDPTRPWNQFSIDVTDKQGNKTLNYQGNWRDIFQNWEALALSFPDYIESMICKFVNACTADGYNPYRVTRDGFDWEVPNPSEAWSNIGYWGDHQIIYLLKLLERSVDYHPATLLSFLTKDIFTYANVPYKIRSYRDILQNPHETIDFDADLNAEIERRVRETGSDGKFIRDVNGQICHVNLTEKILVLMLVKFSNFIPEAGIWMNTQRPEWNDANNALVGYGASMVTVYYLRRYIVFCLDLFKDFTGKEIGVSKEVYTFFTEIQRGLDRFQYVLTDGLSDRDRKTMMDHFGQAGSDYRMNIYEMGFSGKTTSISIEELILFLETGLQYIDHSIRSNRRPDELYHSYNLITIKDDDEISIRRMYEMLEGQVAVLSSGYLSGKDTIKLLTSLRNSALYREDQSSYLLYPNRRLSRFMEKNTIPKELLGTSDRLQHDDGSIVAQDELGRVHFKSQFRNRRVLKDALYELKSSQPDLSEKEIQTILNIYETVFDHQSFTGRSGTFYKYEGLGSIYWHMVSKLLLAVQDTFYRGIELQMNSFELERLKDAYYDIRKGLGTHKHPVDYGAFPTDPYSHTPANGGAEQPGMTGQVKEDFISRFGELGVLVRDGKIRFDPVLLNGDEFLARDRSFHYFDVKNEKRSISLGKGMLAFTLCQVPVVYRQADEETVIICTTDGDENKMQGLEINSELSRSIFQRDGRIHDIQVKTRIQ